jgi:hypothetical protein
MYCYKCGAEVNSELNYCQNCGQAVGQRDQYGRALLPKYDYPPPPVPAPGSAGPCAPPAAKPQRCAVNSGLQLIGAVVVVFIAIRIILTISNFMHSAANNIAADIAVSKSFYTEMSAEEGYVAYTWGAQLHNISHTGHRVTVHCEFTDAAGVYVQQDEVKDVELRAGETLDFKDNVAVPKLSAARIAKARVKVY